MRFDVVVVGSGSAGGVLAARLSEDPRRSVLLLEAGPDSPVFRPPAMLWEMAYERGFMPRGKMIGGCSAMNAAIALRGFEHDYDSWPQGWSWEQVLPYFVRSEADADYGGEPWHGDSGPVGVRRTPEAELTEITRAFIAAAISLGHKPVDDHNRPGASGVGPAPMNIIDGVQQSTAATYLATARTRPNLTVRCDTLVDRVAVVNGRATGVWLADGEPLIEADAVVLAAGACGSPAILLRSGIGPGGELAALGIQVVADLPGVGRNLQDHPLARLSLTALAGLKPARFESILTFSSGETEYPPDLQLFAGAPPGTPSDGREVLVGAALMKPHSRGRLRLRAADATVPPEITLNLLADPRDMPPMRVAVEEMVRLLHAEPFTSLLVEKASLPSSLDDKWIMENVGTYHHPAGTCAMGEVVTPRGAVFGVQGLWVADASIMPELPAVNTNLPAMMVAERLAGWLAEDFTR